MSAIIEKMQFNPYKFEDGTYITLPTYWVKLPQNTTDIIPDIPPYMGLFEQSMICYLDTNGVYHGFDGTKKDNYGNTWTRTGNTITVEGAEGGSLSVSLTSEYRILTLNYRLRWAKNKYEYLGLAIVRHSFGKRSDINETFDYTSNIDETDIINGLLIMAEAEFNQNHSCFYVVGSGIYKNGFPRAYGVHCFRASTLYNPRDVYTYGSDGIFYANETNALNFEGYVEPTDILPTGDPYEPGGTTTPGGGNGSFDTSSDPVSIPSLPTLSALETGFVSIWRPSAAEIRNLYTYMWSNAFNVDSFKKIFANPIDAIMGFGIIPLNPSTTGQSAVKIGNVDTGVMMTKVNAQYYQLDCGTLYLDNFFDTYLEFEPYSTLEIFLPFCGCMPLSSDDFYRRKKEYPGGGKINVTYNIDILSGSCVAFLSCYDADGNTTMTYEFNGNLLTQIPITGNDFTGLYNAVLGIAGNVISGVAHAATGNAAGILGDVINAAHNVTSAKPSINRSGTIGGSYGLLANRKPFLIRNIPREAAAYAQNLYKGYPSHVTKGIGSLSDYTEFEVVYLHNVPASDPELREIEELLKTGVIL